MEIQSFIPNDHHPFLMAGPCSAETEAQVQQTVDELIQFVPQVDVIRAGIWKPRTRPNAFEGVGAIGLSWIKEAAKKYNKPCTVEVANTEHVEAALKAGIDIAGRRYSSDDKKPCESRFRIMDRCLRKNGESRS